MTRGSVDVVVVSIRALVLASAFLATFVLGDAGQVAAAVGIALTALYRRVR